MSQLHILSAAEQVTAHLRERLLRGYWEETLPGVNRLAAELGVNRKTVEAALRQLEHEKLLRGQGPRRQRLIIPPPREGVALPALRVAILLQDTVPDRKTNYIVDLYHTLLEAGHSVVFPTKSMTDLKMDLKRLKRLVEQTNADAWIVLAGSTEVLEWFSARAEPSYAIHGRHTHLPMAGLTIDKRPAFAAATRQLIELGHRRVVMLARKMIRLPEPGWCASLFLDELEAHGIPTSVYNLPDWEESKEGFHAILNALFQVTPPTALMITEPYLFAATQRFLTQRGLRVPEDISLFCAAPDPTFVWCEPSIAHIQDEGPRPVARSVARWVTAVSKGTANTRKTLFPTELVQGDTIGPAPGT